ncbi:hypothetical protein Mal64_18580 [Pseudobythopirellula maris]|uniref:DUF1559 domain-containing protein n=1 Tax=Pseudobythopirellula maris TaxID=2527991 RepID=A0A5C5ZMJ1_9BACT|nr:DUF1559 domain-containing protein [Pseudobythopirellula maris]TWT88378.1 hypothetical protein Mal64_18580 [Pseudobythopirellula maris]
MTPLRPASARPYGDAIKIITAAAVLLAPAAAARAQAPANTPTPAKAQPLGVSPWVSPESFAFAELRPSRLLAAPLAQYLPIEVADAVGEKFLGAPLSRLVSLQAIVEPPMGATPFYALIAKFDTPVSITHLAPELTEHATLGELGGRQVFQSQHPAMPSIAAIDSRTLIAATPAMLKKVLAGSDAAPVETPLTALLSSRPGETDAYAAVALEPVRPLIQLGLMAARSEAPPETHRYFRAADLLSGVELTVDVTGQHDTTLAIHANDAAAADELESLVAQAQTQYRDLVVSEMAEQRLQMAASEDPLERAMARYLDRMEAMPVEEFDWRDGPSQFTAIRLKAGEANQHMMVWSIGVVVALLLPAVQAGREAARRNQALSQAKQIALALHNHHDIHNRFPAQAITDASGRPLLSWRVALLPYLEEEKLYGMFHLDEPWDSPHNQSLLKYMPGVYCDPSGKFAKSDGKSHFLGVAGPQAFFDGGPKGRTFASLTDGSAKTLALVQVDDDHAVEWTKPADYDAAAHHANPVAGIGELHPDVFLAGFGDGHARAVPLDIAPQTLRAMLTVNGRERFEFP